MDKPTKGKTKMKKLIVVAALVVAGFAQASQVNWALTSAADAGGSKVRIWAFLASDSSGTTAASSLISQADAIALIEANDYAGLKAYNQKGGVLAADGTFTGAFTTDNASWGAGQSVSGYAIIFDSTDKNLTGVTKYMVTDVQTLNFATAGDSKTFNLSPSGSWVTIGGGSGGDVPEPTSGLLLLVGGAMLALRRKQK